MTTITLYSIHSGFSNVADDWSLDATHADEFRGDAAEEFALPEGFEVAETLYGDLAIYRGRTHYTVCAGRNGGPVLVAAGDEIALARA